VIDFIPPTFNMYTLNFPPEPVYPSAITEHIKIMDAMHEAVARDRAKSNAVNLRLDRQRKRLSALVAGGWPVEFEPRKHYGEQNSTRGERRRAKLGRA
jgi:hypothetical protein